MRLAAEIALALIMAVLTALAALVLRGRRRRPRRSTLQRTLDAYHAYERDLALLERDEPAQPTGWGFHRRPCGCTEYFERSSQPFRCPAHKVDDEIAGWRI